MKGGRGRGEKKYAVFSSLSPPPPRSFWLAPFPPHFGKWRFREQIARSKTKRLHCRLHGGKNDEAWNETKVWCRVFAFFVHLLKLVTHKALMCCLFIHITHFQRAARGLLHAKCTSSYYVFVHTFRHDIRFFSARWTVLTHALLDLLFRLFENLTRSFCATLVNEKYCLWGFWKSVVSVISPISSLEDHKGNLKN